MKNDKKNYQTSDKKYDETWKNMLLTMIPKKILVIVNKHQET